MTMGEWEDERIEAAPHGLGAPAERLRGAGLDGALKDEMRKRYG
jgi:hypothetical protein